MTAFLQFLQRRHPALKFALVGGIGFIVDTTTMVLLFDSLGLDLLPARMIAFITAVTSNWFLNRKFTFIGLAANGAASAEWLRFFISALLSAVPNLGVFFLLMQLLPESLPAILLAMSAGILIGYACNYQLAKLWVYKSTAP